MAPCAIVEHVNNIYDILLSFEADHTLIFFHHAATTKILSSDHKYWHYILGRGVLV